MPHPIDRKPPKLWRAAQAFAEHELKTPSHPLSLAEGERIEQVHALEAFQDILGLFNYGNIPHGEKVVTDAWEMVELVTKASEGTPLKGEEYKKLLIVADSKAYPEGTLFDSVKHLLEIELQKQMVAAQQYEAMSGNQRQADELSVKRNLKATSDSLGISISPDGAKHMNPLETVADLREAIAIIEELKPVYAATLVNFIHSNSHRL